MTHDEAHTLYTLGQIVRACWPDGRVPDTVHDIAPSQPMKGLGIIHRTRGALPRQAEEFICRLPAPAPEPPPPIPQASQSHYWLGYYHYSAALRAASRLGADEFRRAGEVLYGAQWQSALARDLDVSSRRVREWADGKHRPRAGIWADVIALLHARQIHIGRTLWAVIGDEEPQMFYAATGGDEADAPDGGAG